MEASGLRRGWFFEVIGRLVYAGLDCEGNIHIIIKKDDGFWRDVALRFLEGEVGRILKLRVTPWNHRASWGFKNPRKLSFAVNKSEA